MGPVEEVIEMGTLPICEGIDWYVGIRSLLDKLLSDPFLGAASDMVISPQDAVVPVMEMGILLKEDL